MPDITVQLNTFSCGGLDNVTFALTFVDCKTARATLQREVRFLATFYRHFRWQQRTWRPPAKAFVKADFCVPLAWHLVGKWIPVRLYFLFSRIIMLINFLSSLFGPTGETNSARDANTNDVKMEIFVNLFFIFPLYMCSCFGPLILAHGLHLFP